MNTEKFFNEIFNESINSWEWEGDGAPTDYDEEGCKEVCSKARALIKSFIDEDKELRDIDYKAFYDLNDISFKSKNWFATMFYEEGAGLNGNDILGFNLYYHVTDSNTPFRTYYRQVNIHNKGDKPQYILSCQVHKYNNARHYMNTYNDLGIDWMKVLHIAGDYQ